MFNFINGLKKPYCILSDQIKILNKPLSKWTTSNF